MLERGHGDRVQRRALQVHQGSAGGIGLEHAGSGCGGALGARPHDHRAQRGRQVAVQAVGRGRGGRAPKVPDADAAVGHDDGVTAERPVGDAGLPQPQHGQQDLIQGSVGEAGAVSLRPGPRSSGSLGNERGVPAGPEPAGGEHVGDQDPGASGHEREVGLVLDLLQPVEDEGRPGIPVQAEPPQFRQHPGIGRVTAVDRQLDRLACLITAGELLDPPDLARGPGNIPRRQAQVRDPLGDLRRRRQAQRGPHGQVQGRRRRPIPARRSRWR